MQAHQQQHEGVGDRQPEVPLPFLTGSAAGGNDPALLRRRQHQSAALLAVALAGLIVPVVFLVWSVAAGRAGSMPISSRTLGRMFGTIFLLSVTSEATVLALSAALRRQGVKAAASAFYVALATLLLWAGFMAYLVLRPR